MNSHVIRLSERLPEVKRGPWRAAVSDMADNGYIWIRITQPGHKFYGTVCRCVTANAKLGMKFDIKSKLDWAWLAALQKVDLHFDDGKVIKKFALGNKEFEWLDEFTGPSEFHHTDAEQGYVDNIGEPIKLGSTVVFTRGGLHHFGRVTKLQNGNIYVTNFEIFGDKCYESRIPELRNVTVVTNAMLEQLMIAKLQS